MKSHVHYESHTKATASTSTSTLNGAQMQKSFKAHEAQYQAAWERTFGNDLIEKG